MHHARSNDLNLEPNEEVKSTGVRNQNRVRYNSSGNNSLEEREEEGDEKMLVKEAAANTNNDSFNDVKSFITNQMGSLIRLANSEGSILGRKIDLITGSRPSSAHSRDSCNSSLLLQRIKLILKEAFASNSTQFPAQIDEVAN